MGIDYRCNGELATSRVEPTFSLLMECFNMDLSSKHYCVDLGSANIRVGSSKSGVILTQAAYGVTYTDEEGDTSILALGNSALEMYGRLPKILRHRQLMKDGALHDYGCMVELMRQMFSQLQERTLWVNQQVLLCVSEASNDAEHNQFSQLLRQVGVRKFRYVSRLMAIGTALQLPLMEPQAHCIIDIGGHTTEIGVISCGSVVRSRQFKIGGDTFSLSLLRHLRKQYDVEISIRQADRIKEQFGSAKSTDGEEVVEIFGRSMERLFPTIQHIPLYEIQKGLGIGIEMWISAVEGFFDELPIELSTDIAQTGVVMVGGSAQLSELDWVLSNRLRLMVIVPERSSELCLTGAAQTFRNEKLSGSV